MNAKDLGMHRRAMVALAIVIVISTAGCYRNQYTIALTPRGDAIERRITIDGRGMPGDTANHAPHLEAEEMHRLARNYGVRVDTATHKPYRAGRRFASIPDDVGNWGVYRRESSLLGTTWTYGERFRGRAGESVSEPLLRADSLTEEYGAWLRCELGRHPAYPRLATYLDGELPRGMREFAAATVSYAASPDSNAEARLNVALEEHDVAIGLFQLSLPADDLFGASEATCARVRTRLARILGLASAREISRSLGFLATAATARQSFQQCMRASGFSTELPQRAETLGSSGLSKTDEISVDLAVPSQPTSTNGSWVALDHRVHWHGDVVVDPEGANALPFVCYARWTVRDTMMERRLFGSVVLAVADVETYDAWFSLLDAARRTEWNRMLSSLRPGRLEPLERFRFSGEPPWVRGATSIADGIRRTLLDAAARSDATRDRRR
jgi:hypothetical protein